MTKETYAGVPWLREHNGMTQRPCQLVSEAQNTFSIVSLHRCKVGRSFVGGASVEQIGELAAD